MNKPIKHSNDLSIIAGDDKALGDFKMSIFDRLGTVLTLNKDRAPIEKEVEPIDMSNSDTNEGNDNATSGDGGQPFLRDPRNAAHSSGGSGRPSAQRANRRRGGKAVVANEFMAQMLERVGEVAYAIHKMHTSHIGREGFLRLCMLTPTHLM